MNDLDWRYHAKLWPFSPLGTPNKMRCNDCGCGGWGPMLKTKVWNSIVPSNHDKFFLCETCMVMRLDRALTSDDLRDVPMNHYHPLFRGTSKW